MPPGVATAKSESSFQIMQPYPGTFHKARCLRHFQQPLPSSFNSLEPEWAAAATAVKEQTKGKVRLGAVDATVHQVVSSRYGVSKIKS